MQASLFGRDIQLHLFKIEDIHISDVVRATVTVTDTATGESVTKTATLNNVNNVYLLFRSKCNS